MSITAVPISIRLVRAPMAASRGNGEANWGAKWWTRTNAPSIPISSAATQALHVLHARDRSLGATARDTPRRASSCDDVSGGTLVAGMLAGPVPADPDSPGQTAFLFDLDGTLIDSVYQHVLAWSEALQQVGLSLSVWKIHRRIGMSGGLFVNALARELGDRLDAESLARLPQLHSEAFIRLYDTVSPLPGAAELLRTLNQHKVPWAIATSGLERYAGRARELLELAPDTPMVTRDQVRYAKPDPDLFLTAARQIGVDIRNSMVVGDSVWDLLAAQRARALGIGLLSGGYGREELFYSGAFRVFEDPADLLAHLDEVGVRRSHQQLT
jgi:HAD superfamily hydrolase (TIGR01549 family)